MWPIELFEHGDCVVSVLACVFLTIAYVSSLYIWRSKFNRDHPTTIKRRFFSVLCMMLFAPFITQYFLAEDTLKQATFYEHLGLRTAGLITASLGPLFLTMILFMGPLAMQYYSGLLKLYSEPVYWMSSCQDLVWLRNHVMAPLSEEWVFRSCMMPLLLQCLPPMLAIFMGPLLFGIAHFHHMLEQMKSGFQFKDALMISSFQFAYTTLFGAYSSYIFYRTGHFMSPLLAHMFCNHMGFPNFGGVASFPLLQRIVIIVCFLLGLVLWCFMLIPLTSPDIYDNRLPYET